MLVCRLLVRFLSVFQLGPKSNIFISRMIVSFGHRLWNYILIKLSCVFFNLDVAWSCGRSMIVFGGGVCVWGGGPFRLVCCILLRALTRKIGLSALHPTFRFPRFCGFAKDLSSSWIRGQLGFVVCYVFPTWLLGHLLCFGSFLLLCWGGLVCCLTSNPRLHANFFLTHLI